MELKDVREKIDSIDEKIADLFSARMDQVEQVTEKKRKTSCPYTVPRASGRFYGKFPNAFRKNTRRIPAFCFPPCSS